MTDTQRGVDKTHLVVVADLEVEVQGGVLGHDAVLLRRVHRLGLPPHPL